MRGSPKRENPTPRIVYRYGTQKQEIRNLQCRKIVRAMLAKLYVSVTLVMAVAFSVDKSYKSLRLLMIWQRLASFVVSNPLFQRIHGNVSKICYILLLGEG